MSVILECVKVKDKLRIRFKEYIDVNGKKFTNAYNNYNCRFPKKNNIRQLGRCYKIPEDNINMCHIQGKVPFYVIKDKDIKILDEEKFEPQVDNIFDAGDCVVCLNEKSEIIFVPCGHKCVCDECISIQHNKKIFKLLICPLCRRDIEFIICDSNYT